MPLRTHETTSATSPTDAPGGRERPAEGGRERPEAYRIGGPRVSKRGAENVPLRSKRTKLELGPTVRIQITKADHLQTRATTTTTRGTR